MRDKIARWLCNSILAIVATDHYREQLEITISMGLLLQEKLKEAQDGNTDGR